MKVLEVPKQHVDWSYQHTCSNCSAKLEIEIKDIFFYTDELTFETKCIYCNTSFTLSTDIMPIMLKDKLAHKPDRHCGYDFGFKHSRFSKDHLRCQAERDKVRKTIDFLGLQYDSIECAIVLYDALVDMDEESLKMLFGKLKMKAFW